MRTTDVRNYVYTDVAHQCTSEVMRDCAWECWEYTRVLGVFRSEREGVGMRERVTREHKKTC